MKGDKGVDNKNRRKRMTLSRRGSLTGWAFLAPGAILILFMSFIPIFRALIISFQTGVGAGNKFNGIGNYVRMFQDKVFMETLTNTLFYLIQIPIMILFALILATILN